MGSTLGPVLPRTAIVSLQTSNVPNVNSHSCFWTSPIEETFTILNEESNNYVVQQLNIFHPDLEVTFEIERSRRIPFVGILIIRRKSNIEATVYRKSTDNVIYLNCFSFAPKHVETRNIEIFSRSSAKYHLKKELLQIKSLYIKNNNSRWVIK